MVVAPEETRTTTMYETDSVALWLGQMVANVWVEDQCGDNVCDFPFEFPSYGRSVSIQGTF
jgi:hypothetical protein